MTDERENWLFDSMATLDHEVEAVLLFDQGGRKWTLLCPPGTIARVRAGADLLTVIDEAGYGTEQLAGWPEDWRDDARTVVQAFKRDVYGGSQ